MFVSALTSDRAIADRDYQCADGSKRTDQASVICNACWTLAITLVTYLTLLHPRSKPTGFLDSTYAFPLMAGACVFLAVTPSIVLTIVYRVEDAAGVCWLPATSLAAKLELFIPRASVLVIVIVLYVRMFIFFRTRDMHLLDTSSNSHAVESQRPNANRLSSFRGFASSKNRTEGVHMSQVSTNGMQGTETPACHLSVTPASPVPDTAVGAENDSDASNALSQTRKNSAATTSFSEVENDPSGMGFSPSAITLEPSPARGGATSMPPHLQRLSKHGASSFPAAPTPNAPRHVALSPRQLNKRLSLLMACYPVAYSALVAVSLARLIQQFVTGGRANRGLLYASRILIFSQGAVDGILYYAIQAAFKYWTRSGRIRPTA